MAKKNCFDWRKKEVLRIFPKIQRKTGIYKYWIKKAREQWRGWKRGKEEISLRCSLENCWIFPSSSTSTGVHGSWSRRQHGGEVGKLKKKERKKRKLLKSSKVSQWLLLSLKPSSLSCELKAEEAKGMFVSAHAGKINALDWFSVPKHSTC